MLRLKNTLTCAHIQADILLYSVSSYRSIGLLPQASNMLCAVIVDFFFLSVVTPIGTYVKQNALMKIINSHLLHNFVSSDEKKLVRNHWQEWYYGRTLIGVEYLSMRTLSDIIHVKT